MEKKPPYRSDNNYENGCQSNSVVWDSADYSDAFEIEICSSEEQADFFDGQESYRIVDFVDGPYPNPLVIPQWSELGEISEIGNGLFENSFDLFGVVLPPSLEIIGKNAFWNCVNLESVSILGCTYISKCAFGCCSRLNDVHIANDVTIIGASAFEGCTSLKTLIIPKSVERIGPYAFSGCSQLRTVAIMNPDIIIEQDAFWNCPNISEISLPLSLASEISILFDDREKIEQINWIDQTISPHIDRALTIQLSHITNDRYVSGKAGRTICFDIKNNNRGSATVSVHDVFLIKDDRIHFRESWLEDHVVEEKTLLPNESVACAAIFFSDNFDKGYFEEGALIGIAVSLVDALRKDDDFDERDYAYEPYFDNDYSDILGLENSGICTVVFRNFEGNWIPVATNIPERSNVADVYEIEFANFVVRTNTFNCNLNHDVETIQAFVSVLADDGSIFRVSTMAGYCRNCNCYFLLEADFRTLQQRGKLLCQLLTWDEYQKKGQAIFNGEDMKAESILKRCGYNVNATENLSAVQRQKILALVLENGLYTETGLCSFLDWLISYHGRSRTRDMSAAISKWSEDRLFVLKYNWAERRNVGIKSVELPF